MAAVAAVNHSTSRSKSLMPIVKALFLLSVEFNFKLTALYIPGKLNILADHISRFHSLSSAVEAKRFLLPFVHNVLPCEFHMSLNVFLMLQVAWTPII
jgi:hypothetical protein